MKNKFALLFGLSGLILLTVPRGVSAENAKVAIVVDSRGDASITSPGQPAQKLAVGTEVSEGDIIATGPSAYVKLILTDSSIVKLNQNTQFDVRVTKPEETKGTIFDVKIGQMFMKVFKEKDVAKKFVINTPTSVCAVRGTEIDINVDQAGAATYTLYSGNVDISNDQGTVQLTEGNQTQTQQNQPPSNPAPIDTNAPRWDEQAEQGGSQPKPTPQPPAPQQGQNPQQGQGNEQVTPPSGQTEEITLPEPPQPPIEDASPTVP